MEKIATQIGEKTEMDLYYENTKGARFNMIEIKSLKMKFKKKHCAKGY